MFHRPDSLMGLEPRPGYNEHSYNPTKDLITLMSPIFSPTEYFNFYFNCEAFRHQQDKAAAAAVAITSPQMHQMPDVSAASRQSQPPPPPLAPLANVPVSMAAAPPVLAQTAPATVLNASANNVAAVPTIATTCSSGPQPVPGYTNESYSSLEPHNQSSTVSVKRGLTPEERLRHKRERNRRAAANCRRRKEETIKHLQEENMRLRQEIENLKRAHKQEEPCEALKLES